MRHRISGKTFGRFSSWRKATIRDLAKATLLKQRICTTKVKAKEARKMVEKLITLGKRNTLATKRKAFSILCDHNLVSDLFSKIAPRFAQRVGGYTRVIHLPHPRRGDNATMVFLELTEKVIEAPKKIADVKGKSKAPLAHVPAEKGKKSVATKDEAPEVKKEEGQRVKPVIPSQKVTEKDQSIHKPTKPKILSGVKKIFNKKSPSGS